MRILFDNNVPVRLAEVFVGHEVATAYRQGWAELQNGKLLASAEEAGFDLFVTLDKNIQFQQRTTGRRLAIAVLDPQGQTVQDLLVVGSGLFERLPGLIQGSLVVIKRENV